MNKFFVITLITIISACGQQTEKNKRNSSKPDTTVSKRFSTKNEFSKKNSLNLKKQISPNNDLTFSNGVSHEKIDVIGKTLVIVQFDSLEIEQLKKLDGEDNFYTAADDLMWYNSMLLKKMDSLNIPVKYTAKDTVKIISTTFEQTIVKDSTFSIYTYFYFNGEKLKRMGIFELLNN